MKLKFEMWEQDEQSMLKTKQYLNVIPYYNIANTYWTERGFADFGI